MFIHAVETDQMNGAYNAVSGNWVTNEVLTKAIAQVLKKPLWLPNVPAFVLKIILGEMAEIVINGSKISADKIKKTGFNFRYKDIDEALRNLLVQS
jgi:NAD dependent epimerase/dehydratase family enzyme